MIRHSIGILSFFYHTNYLSTLFMYLSIDNCTLENVGPVVLESSSRKCSFCNHFGASVTCKMDGCAKVYHYPCATASGAFQELSSLTMFCNNHTGQATLQCECEYPSNSCCSNKCSILHILNLK